MKNSALMVAAGVALCGAAFAADTSSTVMVRDNPPPLGLTPRIGIVRAQASSAAASAGAFTYDLNVPTGKSHRCITNVRDVSGSLKLSGVNISNSQVIVSSSIAASGTVATGDIATTICVYTD